MYFLPNDPRSKRTDIAWCAEIHEGDLLSLVSVRTVHKTSEERTFFSPRWGFILAKTSPSAWEVLLEKLS